jgi:hypothetical protein
VADERDYEALLARLGQKDRLSIERHVAAYAADGTPAHAVLWKRLARLLARLASAPGGAARAGAPNTARQYAIQATGRRAVQFFAPDGNYRRQVFALEDARNGSLVIYCVDVMDEALRSGAIRGPQGPAVGDRRAGVYEVGEGPARTAVTVEFLTATNLGSAPDYYRHMVGWNRTALRIVLPADGRGTADVGVFAALLGLCARAAAGRA